VQAAIDQYHRLLAAFLGAGVPTVAAVQGHAFAAGAIDEAVAEEDVLARAVERATALAPKSSDALRTFKRRMHADALRALSASQQL
jgi:enoyl-CoA hydratase/carnithine racemase